MPKTSEITRRNTITEFYHTGHDASSILKLAKYAKETVYRIVAKLKESVERIGFTLLYFKMAVMPLVPETKMADAGKLISLGNLLVRKVT